MVASLVALALISRQGGWAETASRFRSVAETYKKWGITFEVDANRHFTSADGPIPGHLEVSGVMELPDALKVKVTARAGEKDAIAIDLGGTFKIDSEGNATEGNGAVYIDGTGLAGKFKLDREGGLTMEGGLEETFYSLGIKLGKPDEGVFGFGLKLGPLTVNVDPTKWAHRFKEVAPQLGQKIGGVSLAVDGDAMAAALAQTDSPPDRFLQHRLAISFKAGPALGDLNDIQGVLIDEANHDVFVVGVHDPSLPPVSVDVVAALARSVYEADLHPYISIDPQGGNMLAPHKARIGDVPDDLRSSELIKQMLIADYSMKRIELGDQKLEGIPELMDLVEANGQSSAGTVGRFWINPRPLGQGDLTLSKGDRGRYYGINTVPLILSEEIQPQATLSAVPGLSRIGDSDGFKNQIGKMAQTLTSKYAVIERAWPESGFGAARQALQLSNVFTLLRKLEKSAWVDEVIHGLASRAIPAVDVPMEFAGLRSTKMLTNSSGFTWGMQGGMTTAVELPEAIVGQDSIADGAGKEDFGAAIPNAGEPVGITLAQAALSDLNEAKAALRARDYNGATMAAAKAILKRPEWLDPEIVLISALAAQNDAAGFEWMLTRALKEHPGAWMLLYFDALHSEQLARDTAGDFGSVPEGHRMRARESAEKVTKSNPTFSPVYALLGRLDHESNQDDSSLENWNKALALEPKSPEYLLGRAAVFVSGEQFDAGLADITSAIQVAPIAPEAYVVRGQVLRKMGRLPEALKDLEIATKLNQLSWLTWDLLGQSRLIAGDDAGAIEAFTYALALAPKDRIQQIYDANGEIFVVKPFRIPIDPLTNFTKRFGDEPSNLVDFRLLDPDIWLLRGKAHFHLNHWKEAQTDLLWYVAAYPEKKADVAALLSTCSTNLKGNPSLILR